MKQTSKMCPSGPRNTMWMPLQFHWHIYFNVNFKNCAYRSPHCNVTSREIHGVPTVCLKDLFRLTTTKIKAFNYWPFVRGIHRWLVDSPHTGQITEIKMTSSLNCRVTNSGDSHYTRPIIQSMLKCSQFQWNLGALLTICLHGYTCAANDIKASLAFAI